MKLIELIKVNKVVLKVRPQAETNMPTNFDALGKHNKYLVSGPQLTCVTNLPLNSIHALMSNQVSSETDILITHDRVLVYLTDGSKLPFFSIEIFQINDSDSSF